MALTKIEPLMTRKLTELQEQGRTKGREKIITGIVPATDGYGPRYHLQDYDGQNFLRMNSNSYLGLATDPRLITAESKACEQFGVGPGAVRFISGTFQPHLDLERKLADFHGREAAMVFSAAYATVMGVLPQFIDAGTLVISDALNHNCIINAIRLSRPAAKAMYRHLNLQELENILKTQRGCVRRVCLVTDGVFSMRGDHAPLQEIIEICKSHEDAFAEGIVTIVDDSHGVGAFGATGRGSEEVCNARADILIATLGKAFGVNGGYVTASAKVIDYLRETAPFYIYSNPITPAEAAAALEALRITDSEAGIQMLKKIRRLAAQLRSGLARLGLKTLPGAHPIVPILLGDTEKTSALVEYLFAHQILVTGLNFPVVPKGEEEIRLQISAEQTDKDIDYLLRTLADFVGK